MEKQVLQINNIDEISTNKHLVCIRSIKVKVQVYDAKNTFK